VYVRICDCVYLLVFSSTFGLYVLLITTAIICVYSYAADNRSDINIYLLFWFGCGWVSDSSNRSTFDSLGSWLEEVRKYSTNADAVRPEKI